MTGLGDDRTEGTTVRSIQRMIAGDPGMSGEMRAMPGLMQQMLSRGTVTDAT